MSRSRTATPAEPEPFRLTADRPLEQFEWVMVPSRYLPMLCFAATRVADGCAIPELEFLAAAFLDWDGERRNLAIASARR